MSADASPMDAWKIAQALCSVAGISAGQLLLKFGALNLRNPDALGVWLAGFRINAYLVAGIAVLGASTLLWVWLLRSVPLSVAYPFMALAFVIVPCLSFMLLGEPLGWKQVLGSVLIAVGVVVVSS